MTEAQRTWLWASFSRKFFFKKLRLKNRHDRWRKIAELIRLSRAARGRLEWMIFYEKNAQNVPLTCRHFGIARKTFYKWVKRFDADFLKGLDDHSRRPRRTGAGNTLHGSMTRLFRSGANIPGTAR